MSKAIRRGWLCVWLWPLLSVAQVLPARPSARVDPTARTGQFDLRVRVDGSADFWIQGSEIRYAIRDGRPPLDAGSEYTQPIPRARFASFTLEKRDGRGRVELREEPGPRNNYTALIHIEDRDGGDARYHASLRWVVADGALGRNDGVFRRDDSAGRRPWDDRDWRGGDIDRRRLDPGDNDRGRYHRTRDGWFEFSGRVDQTVILRIHDDDVWAETRRGRPLADPRYRFSQALPQIPLRDLQVERLDGRGEVRLLEQPSGSNHYTAVVLIHDPEGGADQYRFRLRWRR